MDAPRASVIPSGEPQGMFSPIIYSNRSSRDMAYLKLNAKVASQDFEASDKTPLIAHTESKQPLLRI
jgi:hypothetical protein